MVCSFWVFSLWLFTFALRAFSINYRIVISFVTRIVVFCLSIEFAIALVIINLVIAEKFGCSLKMNDFHINCLLLCNFNLIQRYISTGTLYDPFEKGTKRHTASQDNRGCSFNPLVPILKISFNTAQLANVYNGWLAVSLQLYLCQDVCQKSIRICKLKY